MGKKILFMVVFLFASVVNAWSHEVKEIISPSHGVFYYYENVYYKITNEEKKEITPINPVVYGLTILDGWYYRDSLIALPPDIHIAGEEYTVSSISEECFGCLVYPLSMANTVTQVEFCNFNGCYQPILWSENIESFGDNCLNLCEFSHLVLPKRLKRLGAECVNNNQFHRIYLEDCEELEEIGEKSFSGNSMLNYVYFPSSLKVIGNNSFCNNKMLTYYDLPGAIVGEECFCDNQSLENVTLSDGIEIGAGCFNNNPKLSKITINSKFSGAENCFNNCPNIRVIKFMDKHPDEELKIPESSFKDIDPEKCAIVVPMYCQEEYKEVIRNCGNSRISQLPIIQSVDYVDSVDNIDTPADIEEVEFFNLSGVKINPESDVVSPQILIKRQGNHVEKIIR
ncbi:MAG: leucine-rich repeat domain-containing protein [Bacteroides sp.]|nr:leucine-rich repeat domain-containing protein [Bacteroides sp.]